jgi:hypothetical protein
MDLNSYLLDAIVDATTPPNETEAAARTRADAIVEMVCAFDPRDAMEAMIACHCVMLQFLLNAAMRAASNINLEPAVQARNRVGATSISRTLHQWVSKFEKVRKGNESRAAKAREAAQTDAHSALAAALTPVGSPVHSSEDAPPRQPIAVPVDKLVIHVPVPNGRATGTVALPDKLIAAAGQAFSDGGVPERHSTVAAR